MRLLRLIRDNLFWFLLPMLIAVVAVIITLFVLGELPSDGPDADFVYPL